MQSDAAAVAQQTSTAVDASNDPTSTILPNASLTPGAVATVDTNVICRPGYATNVRPKGALWLHLKSEVYARYGITRGHRSITEPSGFRHSAYEVDHLIPLEIGGSPTSLENLWPEPIVSAKQKDLVENELHELVCSGRMPVALAQNAVAKDWRTALPSSP
jgi:hypothetical protein